MVLKTEFLEGTFYGGPNGASVRAGLEFYGTTDWGGRTRSTATPGEKMSQRQSAHSAILPERAMIS
jgi:hypothetical protein